MRSMKEIASDSNILVNINVVSYYSTGIYHARTTVTKPKTITNLRWPQYLYTVLTPQMPAKNP